ncbi:MAG: calcium/sodium antiporter [Leptospirales bacterium]|nr:calcium/sodium antiporter [Leptospirales bacterium]
MSLLTIFLFLCGIALLVIGAEWLVRGASRLALAFQVSPLVIGLTVVAYGTSSPEFAVSLNSALQAQPDIAVGNVVGSNIFNNLVVLGLSAAIAPLVIARQLVRVDVPILIGVSLLTWLFALDGVIGRLEGATLFAGAVVYTILLVWISRRQSRALALEKTEAAELIDESERPRGARQILWQIGLLFSGLVLLGIGSRWLVDGAVALARYAGLSELVIGLTIVAAGTSLPEVAASVAAAIKGEREIAVGNVIGSSIFNLLFVLGASSAISARGVAVSPDVLGLDLPVMLATALLFVPVFLRGFSVERWEGGLFLSYYVVYAAYLALKGEHSANAALFGQAALYGLLPITGATLLVLLIVHLRRSRRSAP